MLHTGGGRGDTTHTVKRFECLEKHYINVTIYYWLLLTSGEPLEQHMNSTFRNVVIVIFIHVGIFNND